MSSARVPGPPLRTCAPAAQATRNTVPVPRHWSQKRKYLQGKRGLEKPPFKLPEFIEATGIGEMRQAYLEKAETQKLKQKARERMQPKMGKLDIDYQARGGARLTAGLAARGRGQAQPQRARVLPSCRGWATC